MGKYFIIIGFFSTIVGGAVFLPAFLSDYKALLQTRMSLELKKLRREAGNEEIPEAKLKSIKSLCALQVITDMCKTRGMPFCALYTLTGLMLSLGFIGLIIGIILKLFGI